MKVFGTAFATPNTSSIFWFDYTGFLVDATEACLYLVTLAFNACIALRALAPAALFPLTENAACSVSNAVQLACIVANNSCTSSMTVLFWLIKIFDNKYHFFGSVCSTSSTFFRYWHFSNCPVSSKYWVIRSTRAIRCMYDISPGQYIGLFCKASYTSATVSLKKLLPLILDSITNKNLMV